MIDYEPTRVATDRYLVTEEPLLRFWLVPRIENVKEASVDQVVFRQERKGRLEDVVQVLLPTAYRQATIDTAIGYKKNQVGQKPNTEIDGTGSVKTRAGFCRNLFTVRLSR